MYLVHFQYLRKQFNYKYPMKRQNPMKSKQQIFNDPFLTHYNMIQYNSNELELRCMARLTWSYSAYIKNNIAILIQHIVLPLDVFSTSSDLFETLRRKQPIETALTLSCVQIAKMLRNAIHIFRGSYFSQHRYRHNLLQLHHCYFS